MKWYAYRLYLVFILLASNLAYSTIFLQIPFERQVESNDLFVFGEVVSEKGVMIEGKIFTKYLFKIDQFVSRHNKHQNQLYADIFYFYVIGGDYNGKSVFVQGAPEFDQEKKVGLFLKRVKNRYYLSSLALGKYNFLKNHHGRFFSSEVFPYDSHLGRIEYLTFIEKVKKTFKADVHFKKHRSGKKDKIKLYAKNKFLQSRGIANFEETVDIKSNEDITSINQLYFNSYRANSSNFWYIFSFILLLFFSLLIRKIYHEE